MVSKAVWKYPLEAVDEMQISMPANAVVLHVGTQMKRQPCMWVLVSPTSERVTRIFRIYGTGHTIPENPGSYMGSFLLEEGVLVFHVFEAAAEPPGS